MKKLYIVMLICNNAFGLITVGRETSFVSAKEADQKSTAPIKRHISEKSDDQMSNVHMPHLITPPDRMQMTQDFEYKDIMDVFGEIYHTNYWLGDRSRSGQGSSLATTSLIREELSVLCKALKVDTVLDIGCGDYYWMQTVDLGDCHYVGVDIVPEMIALNRSHYSDATHHFLCLDCTKDFLPSADLVFCRDLFAHLNHQDACNVLRNIKQSGSKFLLMSTHVQTEQNRTIHTGDHYPYNMTIAPFNLPKPLVLIEEKTAEVEVGKNKKAMGLWLISDIDVDCVGA